MLADESRKTHGAYFEIEGIRLNCQTREASMMTPPSCEREGVTAVYAVLILDNSAALIDGPW